MLIHCKKNSRTLRERFGEHRRGIMNNTGESVSIHFNQPKHAINDVQLIPMLHINNNRGSIRRSMEQHLIQRAGTLKRHKSDLRPLVRKPNSENCSDLIFACKKAIIVPDTNYITSAIRKSMLDMRSPSSFQNIGLLI